MASGDNLTLFDIAGKRGRGEKIRILLAELGLVRME